MQLKATKERARDIMIKENAELQAVNDWSAEPENMEKKALEPRP